MSYNDVLSMPVYERRFFISLLTKDVQKREEDIDKMKEQSVVSGGKGKRSTRITGGNLKNMLKSGEVPLK